jgi:DNA-binding NarL/FixJ family response regulator
MSSRFAERQFDKDQATFSEAGAQAEDERIPPEQEADASYALHDNERLRVGLIDSRPLVLAAVAYLLEAGAAPGRSGFLVSRFASATEFLARCPDPSRHVDMVVFSIGAAFASDEQIQEEVRRLRHRLSQRPLVLLCDHGDRCHGIDALRQGIRGYIPTMLSPAIAILAIRLVHAGGTFAPANILVQEIEDNKNGAPRFDSMALKGFTTREREVLDLMWQGKSNKVIAYSLSVSESTVKVYVRQIMKKLGANNRTHAIFLLSQSSREEIS